MTTTEKHYVMYLHAGIPFFRTSVEEIPERIVENVKLNGDQLGFCFFDKNSAVIDGETLTGEPKNQSGWYFKGEKLTLADIKAMYGTEKILADAISHFEEKGYQTFVKTRFGQFLPLEENDRVIF